MQVCEGIDRIPEIAVLTVEIEDSETAERGVLGRWNPPAFEARLARFGGGEADWIKGKAHAGRGSGDSGRGMIEQLPTPLPEQQTKRAPSAGGSSEKGKADCRE